MSAKNILEKIRQSKLSGRGGAAFPAYLKWQAVKSSLSKKKGQSAYLLINIAEGEPDLIKDAYVLRNYFPDVLRGLNLAIKYLGEKRVKEIYCFIRQDYYRSGLKNFKRALAKPEFKALAVKFKFFIKPNKDDYLAGEESALLNTIEGEATKPRLKPPFPGEKGLWQQPTLLHNVETWRDLGLVAQNSYQAKRCYFISGQAKCPGVYELPEDLTITQVLKETDNRPKFKFFVQVGGNACGRLFNQKQLDIPAEGAGAITIYYLKAKPIKELFTRLLNFHSQQSCGQCTPCREGTYRLASMMKKDNFNSKNLEDIIFSLKNSSFCAFGSSLAEVLESYLDNVHSQLPIRERINF